MATFFTYDYVWVNQGEWRTAASDESSAIMEAWSAALKQGDLSFDQVYRSQIVLTPLPCPDRHLDSCTHYRVELRSVPTE